MLEAADQEAIAKQMGRVPRGVVAVAARCPDGHPCVVTTYPLRRQGPSASRIAVFPTLYWLTCPQLCKQVSHLERDGTVAAIQTELDGDEMLREGLRRNHQHYTAERWEMLSSEDRLLVSGCNLLDHFDARGIGGMTNHAAVKCLHMHIAHHLASGNVIGELVMRRYGLHCCGAT